MAIDRTSVQTKHIITQHNHWVSYGAGRGGLHAYTYCGWLYLDRRMEGAYTYGGWWNTPNIPAICPLCVHVATCTLRDAESCDGCRAVDDDAELGHPFDRGDDCSPADLQP